LVVIHEPVLEISCGQKQCAHTDRHTPMTTRPCGLRRAGNDVGVCCMQQSSLIKLHYDWSKRLI